MKRSNAEWRSPSVPVAASKRVAWVRVALLAPLVAIATLSACRGSGMGARGLQVYVLTAGSDHEVYAVPTSEYEATADEDFESNRDRFQEFLQGDGSRVQVVDAEILIPTTIVAMDPRTGRTVTREVESLRAVRDSSIDLRDDSEQTDENDDA